MVRSLRLGFSKMVTIWELTKPQAIAGKDFGATDICLLWNGLTRCASMDF